MFHSTQTTLLNYILVLFIGLFLPSFSYEQEYQYKYKNYTVADHLPSSQIYETIQDKNGFIWFGTDRGLVRFNGQTFKTFTMEDGLGSNCLFYVAEAPNGAIWAYGKNNTLSRIIHNKVDFIQYDLIQNTQNSLIPLSLKVDNKSAKVFYQNSIHPNSLKTNRNKLFLSSVEMQSNGTITYHTNKVNEITIDSSYQHIYSTIIIHNRQVKIKDQKSEKETVLNLSNIKKTHLRVSSNGDVTYFNIDRSVFKIQNQTVSLVEKFDHEILDLQTTQNGDLLIGNRKGLWRIHNDVFKHKKCILEGKQISSILEDKDGGLWVGTLFDGLYYFQPNFVEELKLPNNAAVIYLTGNKNATLFVTQDLSLYYEYKHKIKQLNDPNLKSTIFNIQPINDTKFLYLSSFEKSIIFDLENNKVSPIPFSEKTTISSAPKSTVVPTKTGYVAIRDTSLFYYDSLFRQNNVKHYPTLSFQCISAGLKNEILIGTSSGLKQLRNDSLTDYYKIGNHFSKASITAIAALGDSLLFVGSENNGLLIKKNDSIHYHLTIRNGLTGNRIEQIFVSEKHAFVATRQGINIISTNGEIQHLTSKNGLSSNEVNRLFYRNDTLWVATHLGIDRIKLSPQKIVKKQSNIFLSSISIDQKKQSISDTYLLDHSQEEIDFKINLVDYRLETKTEIKFRLLGHENSWHYSNETAIHYSKINPGDYSFEIAYLMPNNHWSIPINLFKFHKKKPLWQRTFFIITFIPFVILIIVLITYLRFKRLKRFEQDKYNLLDLERQALQSQMNPHFVFNALTSIQSLMVQNEVDLSIDYLVRFSKLTRTALNHSTEKFVPVRNEIELLKNYIAIEQLRFSNIFDFSINIETGLNQSMIPPMIIQPFIENAILHGLYPKNKTGILTINFKKRTHETLLCIIEDNGIGRNVAARNNKKEEKSMGISLIKERLELLLTNNIEPILFIDKKEHTHSETGTIVEIIIPTQNTNEHTNSR